MAKSIKRLLSIVILALVVAVLFPVTHATATEPEAQTVNCYTPGDVNADGLINEKDAIYALYHVFFASKYPVGQDCDFDGDGNVDQKDAIYVLYYSYLPDRYPMSTDGHSYYSPVLETYQEGDQIHVKATITCGCGDPEATVILNTKDAATVDDFSISVTEQVCKR